MINNLQWQWIPFIFWTILIAILSTGSSVQAPFDLGDVIGIDKVGHFFFYCIHAILLAWASTASKFKTPLLVIFFISALYGIVLEFVQYSFYPNRYFEYLDILANIIGSLLGITIFSKFRIEN